MKISPILFSGPMVRAILDGRKTQTRRLIKPQPSELLGRNVLGLYHREPRLYSWPDKASALRAHRADGGKTPPELVDGWGTIAEPTLLEHCSYGAAGDRLWVRETWAMVENDKGADCIQYRANIPEIDWKMYGPWRPSIHMPKWSSRLTLEVVRVRCQRLNQITVIDAIAEGVKTMGEFMSLWDTINGKRAPWSANPWVWVIEFKRVTP